MVDERANLTQQVIAEVRTHFKDKVFSTQVPRSIRLAEAPSFGKPVILYDIRSKGCRGLPAARPRADVTRPAGAVRQMTNPAKRKALGRGLSALIPDVPEPEVAAARPPRAAAGPTEIPIEALEPNPFQPRLAIDPARLDELTASIRESGIIQPILVRRHGERLSDRCRRETLAGGPGRGPRDRSRHPARDPRRPVARAGDRREHPAPRALRPRGGPGLPAPAGGVRLSRRRRSPGASAASAPPSPTRCGCCGCRASCGTSSRRGGSTRGTGARCSRSSASRISSSSAARRPARDSRSARSNAASP